MPEEAPVIHTVLPVFFHFLKIGIGYFTDCGKYLFSGFLQGSNVNISSITSHEYFSRE